MHSQVLNNMDEDDDILDSEEEENTADSDDIDAFTTSSDGKRDVLEDAYKEAVSRIHISPRVQTLLKTYGSVSGPRKLTTDFQPKISSPLKPLAEDNEGNIILGRSHKIHEKYGSKGLMDLGAVCERVDESKTTIKDYSGYRVKMDMLFPHVMFICGKRGSGKSYTLGIVAEELAQAKLGVGTVIIDPIGIFWSLREKNSNSGEVKALSEWDMEPRGMDDVKVFIPYGFYEEMKGIANEPFSIATADLTTEDWCAVFDIDRFKSQGLLIGDVIEKIRNGYTADMDGNDVKVPPKHGSYSIGDMIQCIEYDKKINSRDEGYAAATKRSIISRLKAASRWGIFSVDGTPISQIAYPDRISVIDVSHPKLGEAKRSLIAGIMGRKIFEARMATSRKSDRKKRISFGSGVDIPVTWLLIDEAHLLLPHGKKTSATEALVEYAKLGRKPGCALVLATQRPSATNDDILSQTDLIIGHNLALEDDMTALRRRIPAKIPQVMADSDFIRALPVGVGIIADQKTQERAMLIQFRPRLSQHSGKAAMPGEVVSTAVDETVPVGEEESFNGDVSEPTTTLEDFMEKKGVKAQEVIDAVRQSPTPIPQLEHHSNGKSSGEVSPKKDKISPKAHGGVKENVKKESPELPEPPAEKDTGTIMSHELYPGSLVVIEDVRPSRIFKMAAALVRSKKIKPMLITRTKPSRIIERYNLNGEAKYFWLSNKSDKEVTTLPVNNLGKIAHEIEAYIKENPSGSIFIEGLEYLTNNNEFPKVMRFVEALHEDVASTSCTLYITYNPDVFDRSSQARLETEADEVMLPEKGVDESATEHAAVKKEKKGGANKELSKRKKGKKSETVESETVKLLVQMRGELSALQSKIKEMETERREVRDRDMKRPDSSLEEERNKIRKQKAALERKIKKVETKAIANGEIIPAKLQIPEVLDAEVEYPAKEKPQPSSSGKGRGARIKEPHEVFEGVIEVVGSEPLKNPRKAADVDIEWHSGGGEVKKLKAFKPNVSADTALAAVQKELKHTIFGRAHEAVEDLELIGLPFYLVLIRVPGGFLKKEKNITIPVDGVSGEIILDAQKKIKRTRGMYILYGLNDTQVRILRAIKGRRGKTEYDVSKNMKVTLRTIKKHLKKLEEEGMIRSETDEDGVVLYKRRFEMDIPDNLENIEAELPVYDEYTVDRTLVAPTITVKETRALINSLLDNGIILGVQMVYYPYWRAVVKGKGERRDVMVDAVHGTIDPGAADPSALTIRAMRRSAK